MQENHRGRRRSRRSFLTATAALGGLAALSGLLAACGSQAAGSAVTTPGLTPTAALPDTMLSDAAIRALIERRLAEAKEHVGIIVGRIGPSGRSVVSHGPLSQDRPQSADGETMFEIGSITKVFTATLLADMLAQKRLGLDDPITSLLPANVKVPSRNGAQITLRHLVTHTSGLPRLPEGFTPKDEQNPYADYTVEKLYAFLASYVLPRDIGAEYEYSNLGAGLLGHSLALKAGSDYETLVKTRICAPLGLASTTIALSAEQQARLATGHDALGNPAKNWDLPSLAGAGALRSTANDMLSFLAANLGLAKTDLLATLQMTHAPLHTISDPAFKIGMGWHITTGPGRQIVWHNGGTGGYRSFIGFDAANQTGVVVLANSNGLVDDLGFHILDQQYPLETFTPRVERTPVSIDPAIYPRYVGEYQLAADFSLTVTYDGTTLVIQATGQPALAAYPESETSFFLREVDAQISFVQDAAGKVTGLVLHQGGQDSPAAKIK